MNRIVFKVEGVFLKDKRFGLENILKVADAKVRQDGEGEDGTQSKDGCTKLFDFLVKF